MVGKLSTKHSKGEFKLKERNGGLHFEFPWEVNGAWVSIELTGKTRPATAKRLLKSLNSRIAYLSIMREGR